MNRIEPIGPSREDVPAIAPIPRRAPDRDADTQRRGKRRATPDTETRVQQPLAENGGEHIDIRA